MNTLLLIGLGNPGQEYDHTPHNVGFEVVDALWGNLTEQHYSPTPWKHDKASNALLSSCMIDDRKIILAKPQTFMNLSGNAVKALYSASESAATIVLVLHDDIDLAEGTVRIRKNGSSAGHKGIQNIIDVLGTEEFARVRIGIRPAPPFSGDTTTFVLQKMPKARQELFHAIYARIAQELLRIPTQGIQDTTLTIP